MHDLREGSTRVKWRVAVPSVQGKWSVEEKGVEDKTENPSIGGKFKILLRLLAKRDLSSVVAGVRIVRDWQRLLRRLIGVCVCVCVKPCVESECVQMFTMNGDT